MGEVSLNYVLTAIFVSLINQISNNIMSRMCMTTCSRCGTEIGETNSCQPPPKTIAYNGAEYVERIQNARNRI
jgi:hypothetical protein